jgi:hypothetical protein
MSNRDIETDPTMALAESLEMPTQVVLTQSAAIAKSEIEAQITAAHSYPRSVSRFLREATGLATISVDVAESCIYSLPRAGKAITGPSVRLAEIMASSYGNLQVAARIVDVEDTEIIAQGMAWDTEKNLRCVVETRRRITDKHGRRYNEDMITVTGNAAASIALRNAIFRVVPRAYVDSVFERVRQTALGKASTLAARRSQVLERLALMGATQDRVLAALDVRGVDDITLEHLELLIGWGTAAKNGDRTIDELFPPVADASSPTKAPEGRRVSLKRGKDEKKSEPKNAPPTASASDEQEEPEREPGED